MATVGRLPKATNASGERSEGSASIGSATTTKLRRFAQGVNGACEPSEGSARPTKTTHGNVRKVQQAASASEATFRSISDGDTGPEATFGRFAEGATGRGEPSEGSRRACHPRLEVGGSAHPFETAQKAQPRWGRAPSGGASEESGPNEGRTLPDASRCRLVAEREAHCPGLQPGVAQTRSHNALERWGGAAADPRGPGGLGRRTSLSRPIVLGPVPLFCRALQIDVRGSAHVVGLRPRT